MHILSRRALKDFNTGQTGCLSQPVVLDICCPYLQAVFDTAIQDTTSKLACLQREALVAPTGSILLPQGQYRVLNVAPGVQELLGENISQLQLPTAWVQPAQYMTHHIVIWQCGLDLY